MKLLPKQATKPVSYTTPILYVCVKQVNQVNPMLREQNVPTKMAISEILVLVGFFFLRVGFGIGLGDTVCTV